MGAGYVCTSCGASAAVADRNAICPTCKNGLLTPAVGSMAPRAVATRAGGGTFSATGGAGWKVGALAGAGVITVVLGFLYGPMLLDRMQHPSKPVGGEYTSELLGLTVDFEPGWRHLTAGDQSKHLTAREIAGGMVLTPEQEAAIGEADLRMAMFFRGGTSEEPHDAVFIALIDFDSALMREVLHEAGIMEAARGGIRGMMDASGQKLGLKMGGCEEQEAPNGAPLVRCLATATSIDQRAVVIYAYPTEGGMGIVLYMSQASLDDASGKAQALIASMR